MKYRPHFGSLNGAKAACHRKRRAAFTCPHRTDLWEQTLGQWPCTHIHHKPIMQ